VISPVLTTSLKIRNNIIHRHTASPTKRNIGKIMSVGNNKCKFPEKMLTAGKIANKKG